MNKLCVRSELNVASLLGASSRGLEDMAYGESGMCVCARALSVAGIQQRQRGSKPVNVSVCFYVGWW